MKRISSLKADEKVTIALHGSHSVWEVDAKLVRIDGTGDDARATFVDDYPERPLDTTEWELYRYNGGWVWGSSCDRASLIALR